MTSMPEPVQAALSALRLLQPADRDTARTVLGIWARRDELSDAQVTRLLDYYFAGGPQNDTRIDDNADYQDGYIEGFLDAVRLKAKVHPDLRAAMESLVGRIDDLTDAEICAVRAAVADMPCLDDGGFAERFLERQRQARTADLSTGKDLPVDQPAKVTSLNG